MLLASLALLVFPAVMIFAAASDMLTMRISNLSVLVLLVGFAIVALIAGLSLDQLWSHLLVAGIVLLVGFTFFAFGWVGGGDAKLAAGIGLWLGTGPVLLFVVYAGLWGGMLTMAILAARRWPLPETLRRVTWVDRLHNAKSGVPYGIALAAAALFVYPQTDLYQLLLAAAGAA